MKQTSMQKLKRRFPRLFGFVRAVAQLDYDDSTLDYVRLEALRLIWMFPCLQRAEIWLSSKGKGSRHSYHVKLFPAVSLNVMEMIVAHSHCHKDYRTYVLERHECTLRTGKGALGQPRPVKIEDIRSDRYALRTFRAGQRTAKRRRNRV